MTGWDTDYTVRGNRWGGAASELPALPAGARVLECGCGNGKTLAAMRSRGWEVIGIDISPAAVSLASAALARGNFSLSDDSTGLHCCSVVCGDVTSLPFSDNSFDAVFCWHVLGHLPATVWPTAASEMRRVLRPSGKIFFKGFSRNDMRCGKGREVEPYSYLRGDGIVTHYFTDTELREVFGTGELTRVSWKMRVRGTDYLREELCGAFGREGFD
ncbi:MAG TPA: class I SAM-dependent methyltransferase [Methanocorpusculum sp.]|nr:class I SAM-dependent methyltransferase [Methanocorpusculum sp.]